MGGLLVVKDYALRMKKWTGEMSIDSRCPSRLPGAWVSMLGRKATSIPHWDAVGSSRSRGRAGIHSPELHCFDALTQVWSMTFHDQLSRWATTPYSWQKYRSYYITKASTTESFLQIINKHCILFINLVKSLQGLAQLPDESAVCLLWMMLQAEELSEQPTPFRVQLPQPESAGLAF